MHRHQTRAAANKKSGQHADGAFDEAADKHRKPKPNEQTQVNPPTVLPHHHGIVGQILDVFHRRIGLGLEHNPANVRVPKSFFDVVRIRLVIDVFVMPPMIGAPVERRILHRRGAAQQRRHLHGPTNLKRKMRQQPVIPKGDAHSGENIEPHKEAAVYPPVELRAVFPNENRQRENRDRQRTHQRNEISPVHIVSNVLAIFFHEIYNRSKEVPSLKDAGKVNKSPKNVNKNLRPIQVTPMLSRPNSHKKTPVLQHFLCLPWNLAKPRLYLPP